MGINAEVWGRTPKVDDAEMSRIITEVWPRLGMVGLDVMPQSFRIAQLSGKWGSVVAWSKSWETTRYFSPNYGSGPWPVIRNVITKMQELYEEVYYFGDNFSLLDAIETGQRHVPVTPERLAEIDAAWERKMIEGNGVEKIPLVREDDMPSTEHIGGLMKHLLDPPTSDGPPWVHTISPSIEEDEPEERSVTFNTVLKPGGTLSLALEWMSGGSEDGTIGFDLVCGAGLGSPFLTLTVKVGDLRITETADIREGLTAWVERLAAEVTR